MNDLRNLRIEIEPHLRWDKDVFKTVHESLPYFVKGFKRAHFHETSLEVAYASDDGVETDPKEVKDLVSRVSISFRDAEERVFTAHEGRNLVEGKDPYVSMVEDGWIAQTGRGKFVYSGDFLVALNAVDKLIREFALSLGGMEELYPTTVRTQTLLDVGYLSSFPHHAVFSAPANLDARSLSILSDGSVLAEGDRNGTVENLAFPAEVLAPTVCYHCFEARKNLKVEQGIVTALNKCHRHEPVDVGSLERLTTYWMREIIIFDRVEQVQSSLENISEWTSEVLTELNITFKIVSANDPFFADNSSDKRLFQNAYELKKEVKIPVFGGNWISVGSFNNHQSSIVSKLEILGDGWSSIASGCAGWGLERLLYGLFSHFGQRLDDWPRSAKDLLKI